MHNRRLITTNLPRKPYRPDIWCHSFAKYLGRTLTPAEKTVIAYLKQSRRHHRQHPVMVIDSPGHDSSALLVKYLHFRLETSPPAATGLLYTPVRTPRYVKDKRLTHLHYQLPERMRGRTPAFMLLLNAHQAKTFSPLYRNHKNFRRLCATLFPILDTYGFLIIHLVAQSPPPIAQGIMRCSTHPPEPPPDPPPVTVITIAPPSSDLSAPLALLALFGISGLLSPHPPSVKRYAVLRGPKPNRTARAL